MHVTSDFQPFCPMLLLHSIKQLKYNKFIFGHWLTVTVEIYGVGWKSTVRAEYIYPSLFPLFG